MSSLEHLEAAETLNPHVAGLLAVHLVSQVLEEACVIANAADESGQPWRYLATLKRLRSGRLSDADEDISFLASRNDSDGVNENKAEMGANVVATSTPQKLADSPGSRNKNSLIGQGDEEFESSQTELSTSMFINHLFEMSEVERVIFCDDNMQILDRKPVLSDLTTEAIMTKAIETYVNNTFNIVFGQEPLVEEKSSRTTDQSSYSILADAFVSDCGKNVAFMMDDIAPVSDDVAVVTDDVTSATDYMALVNDNVTLIRHNVVPVNHNVSLLSEDMGLVNHNIAPVNNDVALINGDVAPVKVDMALVNDDVSLVNDDMDLVNDDVLLVNYNVALVNDDIDPVNEDVTLISGDVTPINCDMTLVNDDVSPVDDDVGLVNDDVLLVNGDMALVNDDGALVNEDVAPVNYNVDVVNDDVSPVNADITLVNDNVALVYKDVTTDGYNEVSVVVDTIVAVSETTKDEQNIEKSEQLELLEANESNVGKNDVAFYENAFLTLNRDEQCSDDEREPVVQDPKEMLLQEVELSTTNCSDEEVVQDPLQEESKELTAVSGVSGVSRKSKGSMLSRCRSQGARLLSCLQGWWRRKTPGKRRDSKVRGRKLRMFPLSPDARRRASSLLDHRDLYSPSPSRSMVWKFNTVNEILVKSSRWKDYAFEEKPDECGEFALINYK